MCFLDLSLSLSFPLSLGVYTANSCCFLVQSYLILSTQAPTLALPKQVQLSFAQPNSSGFPYSARKEVERALPS